jgi:hypothetical protein
LQRSIVGDERFPDPIELEQRIAAVAQRIKMLWIARKCTIETAERFHGPAEFQKCDAATIEQFDIIGRKPQPLVVASQRPLELPERVKHQPQTGKPFGAGNVRLQCRLDQRQRCVKTTALVIDLSQAVQRIEIQWIVLKNGAVEAFGLTQLTLLVRAQGAPKQA